LESAAVILQNQLLYNALTGDSHWDDRETHALFAAVWLTCCFRAATSRHIGDGSASQQCGALRLAYSRVANINQTKADFLQMTLYWERRLYEQTDMWMTHNDWFASIPTNKAFPASIGANSDKIDNDDIVSALNMPLPTYAVTNKVISKEVASRRSPAVRRWAPNPAAMAWVTEKSIQLMVTVDRHTIESCVRGTVARDSYRHRHKTSLELAKEMLEVEKPVIYSNVICDSVGINPTARQLEKVLLIADAYLVDDPNFNEEAAEIDAVVASVKWPKRYNEQGLRRYMDFYQVVTKRLQKKDARRRNITRQFIVSCRRNILQAIKAGLGDVPLARNLMRSDTPRISCAGSPNMSVMSIQITS
jgi:hypothetical protein